MANSRLPPRSTFARHSEDMRPGPDLGGPGEILIYTSPLSPQSSCAPSGAGVVQDFCAPWWMSCQRGPTLGTAPSSFRFGFYVTTLRGENLLNATVDAGLPIFSFLFCVWMGEIKGFVWLMVCEVNLNWWLVLWFSMCECDIV